MSFKKSVYIAVVPEQLKRGKEMEFGDTNVRLAIKVFRVKEEKLDCKISFGRNMFAASKP